MFKLELSCKSNMFYPLDTKGEDSSCKKFWTFFSVKTEIEIWIQSQVWNPNKGSLSRPGNEKPANEKLNSRFTLIGPLSRHTLHCIKELFITSFNHSSALVALDNLKLCKLLQFLYMLGRIGIYINQSQRRSEHKLETNKL